MINHSTSRLNRLVALLLIIYATKTSAEVVLDGTLGPARPLTAPNFDITADLGQQYGSNLFHSFELFNLNKGETATFSGPSTIENIISRVTSGEYSEINGTLRSDIPQANLYLINPAGFIFGPNAGLDLQGSLHISTASQLRLGQTGIFETRHPERSILVSAPPSAFGFLETDPAAIKIKGSKLATLDGQTLSMLGGEIGIDAGHLRAVSGRINLAAITSAQGLNNTSNGLLVDETAQLGKILLTNGTMIDVGKEGGGDIYIRGGKFVLNNSEILANTEIDQNSGVIAIEVNELHLEDNAGINSQAFGEGQGGQILIKVAGPTTLSNDSSIRSRSLGTQTPAGDAGNILLQTQCLNLENSIISTTTTGPGLGGDITIQADENITLIGSADFSSAMIQASSEPQTNSTSHGDAGRIYIRAKNLNLSGTASKIDNSTLGDGQGGSIILEIANTLNLTDNASISSDSAGLGNAGSIHLDTTTLTMNQGTISTTASQAQGGNIIINARHDFKMDESIISATVSGGLGNGGNLAIGHSRLFYLNNSHITANASAGNGGLVLITTDNPIQLYGNSSITASSETGLDGEVKIDDIYNVDISTLPVEFLDASTLIKKRCAASSDTQASSFFVTGRGGLPNAPDDLQTYMPGSIQIPSTETTDELSQSRTKNP